MSRNVGDTSKVSPEQIVVSAEVTDIASKSSALILITGRNRIRSFGTAHNRLIIVRFEDVLTIEHNENSLYLPSRNNIVTEPGDFCFAVSDTVGNWRVYGYSRSNGRGLNQLSVDDLDHVTVNGQKVPISAWVNDMGPRLSTFIPLGLTPDQAAIGLANAINYVQTNKKHLIIDSGREFFFNKRIKTKGRLQVVGENLGTSVLVFTEDAAEGGGWFHTIDNTGFADTFIMRNVSLFTKGKNAGTAIEVVSTASAGQDRLTTQVFIENCFVRGYTHPRTDGWFHGIHCNGNCQVLISGNAVCGYIDPVTGHTSQGFGIALDNDAFEPDDVYGAKLRPAGFMLNDNYVQAHITGIRCNWFEGVGIKGGGIQGCRNGITCSGNFGYPDVTILGVHLNCTNNCIVITKMSEIRITKCDFYLQDVNTQGSTGRSAHIVLNESVNYGSIEGNIFTNFDDRVACDNIRLDYASQIIIGGNNFKSAHSDRNRNPARFLPGADPNAPLVPADATGVGVQMTPFSSRCKVLDTNTWEDINYLFRVGNAGNSNVVAGMTRRGINQPGGVGICNVSNEGYCHQSGECNLTLGIDGKGLVPFVVEFAAEIHYHAVMNGNVNFNGDIRLFIDKDNNTSAGIGIIGRYPDGSPAGGVVVQVNWSADGRMVA